MADAISAANRYWPSTPMLKRFILNPTATAVADNMSGVARFIISSSWLLCVPVLMISEYAAHGSFPVTASSTAQMPSAMITAARELAIVNNPVVNPPLLLVVVSFFSKPLKPVSICCARVSLPFSVIRLPPPFRRSCTCQGSQVSPWPDRGWR